MRLEESRTFKKTGTPTIARTLRRYKDGRRGGGKNEQDGAREHREKVVEKEEA
jgi:hypothetical protein